MSEQLGKVKGLEITRIDTGQARVALDFTSSGPGPQEAGPFVALTVMQWTVLQQLARSIPWPNPPAA
jgi:hypothetical protein